MKQEIIAYNVLDFTEYPGPRYKEQGPDSGEEFYDKILKPYFTKILKDCNDNTKYILQINLDNTAGYASSFLDEAFGNLSYDFGDQSVIDHLDIISTEEPDWIDIIKNQTIPEWNQKRLKGIPKNAKKT
tara:strand:- start:86 stop:472 length:387 start_codon:yes stop_codon:yes gene_type:complete